MRRGVRHGQETLTPDSPTDSAGAPSGMPDGRTGRETPGGNVKKKGWAPFVSLGVAQAALMLGIAGFGFAHLDSRMDRLEGRIDRLEERIEARLDNLDRRVSRIEGVLRLLPIDEAPESPASLADGDPAPSAPDR